MPIIAGSARKHGAKDEARLHVFANPIRIVEVDDGLRMFVGPDQSARLPDFGVVEGDLATVIAHAMSARSNFLR
ncbi:hypothetical protein LWF15_33620 [Kineosporia rhizophila]|uniref:hypothetical protein n=1 Tax=Kineosporia rhizophila TaxID=84633 RepID=UPI000AA3792F|nr:hypothetical protein [Kineosporia rhizophila]MCE0540445.1 hypothetical protein [Kineosporia rhizophila]